MSVINYENFVGFVNKQPPSKPIEHGGHVGWCNCSVGEFIKESLGIPVVGFDPVVQSKAVNFVLSDEFPAALYEDLVKPLSAQENFPTYGALQKRLN